MKKAFSFIELLVTIVILGILATITTKVLIRVYENYYYSKEYNRLLFQSDVALNLIASKLQNRIKNSVIGVECNVTNSSNPNDTCIKGSIKSFDSITNITDSDKYKVLEWLGVDEYSKRGMWSDKLKRVVPGFSGFVDLKKTDILGFDEYNITSLDSNFTMVKVIDSNWTSQYGISGDIFDNNYSVLIFSGSDDRGDFLDINTSYGFYKKIYSNCKATRVFRINEYDDFLQDFDGDGNPDTNVSSTRLNIKAFDESNSTTVYQKYYIVNSAFAIVPEANLDASGNVVDYNLTLFYNYYPWKGEIYTDGNSSLLVSNVTQFKFKEENGVLRILLCIDSPKVKINNEPVTVCREKVVF